MSHAFRFDSIVQLRQRQRDAAAMSVDEVARAIRMVDERLSEIQTEISNLDSQRRSALVGSVAVTTLTDIQRHQLILLGNIQHLNQQRATLLQEKNRRDHILLKAQQALKSLEKLRDKRLDAVQAHEAQMVQNRLDEWANTRVASEANRK
jgi:flagellar protein FliJ